MKSLLSVTLMVSESGQSGLSILAALVMIVLAFQLGPIIGEPSTRIKALCLTGTIVLLIVALLRR